MRALLGCETIRVNSLHGQGILEPGERVVIEGVAEDGTIEAIRIADAPGFALGVQWHAEYDPQRNPINRNFEAFVKRAYRAKALNRCTRARRAVAAGTNQDDRFAAERRSRHQGGCDAGRQMDEA